MGFNKGQSQPYPTLFCYIAHQGPSVHSTQQPLSLCLSQKGKDIPYRSSSERNGITFFIEQEQLWGISAGNPKKNPKGNLQGNPLQTLLPSEKSPRESPRNKPYLQSYPCSRNAARSCDLDRQKLSRDMTSQVSAQLIPVQTFQVRGLAIGLGIKFNKNDHTQVKIQVKVWSTKIM